MKPLLTAVAATLVLAPMASAWAKDSRLVERLYDPNLVVMIEGRAGVQATISFGEDEHIENVAIGDSNSWQVTPNKRANILFVKPLQPRGRTNLTVVTDRHTYLFDLVASAQSRPIYILRFTYPAPLPNSQASSTRQLAGGMSDAEAQAVLGAPKEALAPDPARLNFAWRPKGSAALLPERIYDDGEATFLRWNDQSQLPAMLVRNEKGEEGAINYAVREGVIVIEGVPKEIILRAGRQSATITNQAQPKIAANIPPLPMPDANAQQAPALATPAKGQ